MLLRWPGGLNLTGITTVGELSGKRAGYARYALALEGRQDVPVAAGADVAQGYYRQELRLPPEERYWPEPVQPFSTLPRRGTPAVKEEHRAGCDDHRHWPLYEFVSARFAVSRDLETRKVVPDGRLRLPASPWFPAMGQRLRFQHAGGCKVHEARPAKFAANSRSPAGDCGDGPQASLPARFTKGGRIGRTDRTTGGSFRGRSSE